MRGNAKRGAMMIRPANTGTLPRQGNLAWPASAGFFMSARISPPSVALHVAELDRLRLLGPACHARFGRAEQIGACLTKYAMTSCGSNATDSRSADARDG